MHIKLMNSRSTKPIDLSMRKGIVDSGVLSGIPNSSTNNTGKATGENSKKYLNPIDKGLLRSSEQGEPQYAEPDLIMPTSGKKEAQTESESGDLLNKFYVQALRRRPADPEAELNLLVLMGRLQGSLVQILSQLPASSEFIISINRKDRLSTDVQHCIDEHDDSPRDIQNPDNNQSHYSAPFALNVVTSNQVQQHTTIKELIFHLNRFRQAAQKYGIANEITENRRMTLSKSFSTLNLAPDTITQLASHVQSLHTINQKKAHGGTLNSHLPNHDIVAGYGVEADKFTSIADQCAKINLQWQIARNRVVAFHLGLVLYLARQYSTDPDRLTDLVQEGNIGLIKAVERFNYQLGFRFSTYATYWIRLAITRYLARNNHCVRLPYRTTQDLGNANKKRAMFRRRNGLAPSVEELSNETGITRQRLHELNSLSQKSMSLNTPVDEHENLTLMSLLEQETFLQPVIAAEAQYTKFRICKAIKDLNQREAFIVRQRFGIGVYAEKTLNEIGNLLGLTRERVRQIEASALKKIQHYLEPLIA